MSDYMTTSSANSQAHTSDFVEHIRVHLAYHTPDTLPWVARQFGFSDGDDENGEPIQGPSVKAFYRDLRRYEAELARHGVHWARVQGQLTITDGDFPGECLTVQLLDLLRRDGGRWQGAPHELAIELLDFEGDYTPEELGRAVNAEGKLLRGLGVQVRRKKVRGRRLLEITAPIDALALDTTDTLESGTREPVVIGFGVSQQ